MTRGVRMGCLVLGVGMAAACGSEPPPRTTTESPVEAPYVLPPAPPPSRFARATPAQEELATTGQHALLATTGPMSPLRFDAAFDQALMLERAERWEDAERALRDLRRDAPPNGKVEFALGRVLVRLERHDEAVEVLTRAYRIDAERLDAMLALRALHSARGQHFEASEMQLRFSRQAERMGHALASSTPWETKARLIANLNVGVPHPEVARALLRGLDTDEFRARVAALEALIVVGTADIRPTIEQRLREAPDGRYASLYRAVLDGITERERSSAP
jgi:tetratricopeptide (TPR) repeat protein